MPTSKRPKKADKDLTTREAIKRLFPKEAIREAKREVSAPGKPPRGTKP